MYDLLALRQAVFVVEQNCPYLDADGLDVKALHIFLKEESTETMLACSRVLPPGIVYPDFAAIGRMAVHPGYRGKGYAKRILEASIEFCRENYKNAPIKISAQSYLQSFYGSYGFTVVGEPYLEDGIPHLAMLLT